MRLDLSLHVTNPGSEDTFGPWTVVRDALGNVVTDREGRFLLSEPNLRPFRGGRAAPEPPPAVEERPATPRRVLEPSDGSIDGRYALGGRHRGHLPTMDMQPAPPMDTKGQREAARDAESLHAEDAAAQERRRLASKREADAFRAERGIKPGHGRSADTPSRSPIARAAEHLRRLARQRGELVLTPRETKALVKMGISATDVGAEPGPG